jgi:hypothetical protein
MKSPQGKGHSQTSSTLEGTTHHGHFEVTSRQDVEHAIILSFCGKFIDRRRLREATTELASLLGRKDRALHWMLRETKSLEEAGGFSVENLPLLAKRIRTVEDGLTITGIMRPCPKSPMGPTLSPNCLLWACSTKGIRHSQKSCRMRSGRYYTTLCSSTNIPGKSGCCMQDYRNILSGRLMSIVLV